MVLQSSMGQYKLDVRYGDRNSLPYYTGILDSTVISNALAVQSVTAGRAFSLTTAGKLVPGVLAVAAAGGGPIPYFSWSGLDENNYPDTQRDRGMPNYGNAPAAGIGAPGSPGWPGIALNADLANPVGGFATIQHIAAAELSTTQFDQTAGAAYPVGAPLTAVSAAATGAGGVTGNIGETVRGLLRPVEAATDVIVGYVAPAGVFTGPEGYQTLAFTPAFVAGTTVPDTEVADD